MPSSQPAEAGTKSPCVAVVLGGILFAFIEAFPLLSPILLSLLLILLLTFAVNPLVRRIRGVTGGRKGAAALLAVALITLVALAGWAFLVPLKSSWKTLSEQVPVYWERLQKPLIKLEKQADIAEKKLQAEVTTEIAQATNGITQPDARHAVAAEPPKATKEPVTLRAGLGQLLQTVAGGFAGVAFSAAKIMVVLATVFCGATFTLMNPRPVMGAFFSLVPAQHHGCALRIVQRIGEFMPRWALATLTSMLIIGLMVFLLMWPLFGFVDAMVLGMVAAVFEAVPYVGPVLSVAPALLFALGEGGATPLWVLLAYLTVQTLENNVISPLIVAHSMKLHPVAVIFSMLLCAAAFGVLGVVVAPPIVAVVVILHDELYRKRFLPSVTDADLDRLSQVALGEAASKGK